jgi:hypothetical protein
MTDVQLAWVFQNATEHVSLTKMESIFVINAISVRNTQVEENSLTHGINSELTSESNTGGEESIGNK